MKNIQVIDGAENSSYSIYAMTDEEFFQIFPNEEQDVEFIEDALEILGEIKIDEIFRQVWDRYIPKPEAIGIHGTLFYELLEKKKYYPRKIEKDIFSWHPGLEK